MRSISGGIDGLEAVFDEASLVADAGLLLAGTVMGRLGLEALIDDTVRLDGREAGSGSGRKVLSLVASMLVGGCCIDDAGLVSGGREPPLYLVERLWRGSVGAGCSPRRVGLYPPVT